MLKRDPIPKVISFDCYGTMVQWHRAMRDAAHAILAEHKAGEAGDQGQNWADRLREVAVEYQQRLPFREYRFVLRASLEKSFAEAGHIVTPADYETLIATLRRIEPHPEVPAALARLRARYKLAIISSTDDDLITDTVAAIGTPIDFVITAQQARAYKPDHQLFLYAYSVMGVSNEETIHVGMGQFTDLKVCHELGIRSVWINRIGEPLNPDWPPDDILSDLSKLPELLFQP